MAKYIVKRVLMAILTIWIVATLTFFLMHAVPGGPFVAEKSISLQAQEALNKKFGMDKSVPQQYVNYMIGTKNEDTGKWEGGVIRGDFSLSLRQRGRTVTQIISSRFPVSAKIGGMAILLALVVGIPLGSIAALNRGKWADNVIIVFATCGIAFPSFVICTVGMFLFSIKLGWLPSGGLSSMEFAPWTHYVLPVFSLSFYPMAYITRLMRSSMLDVIGQDYMRTARAKGLSQTKTLFKHALRNAILPVITYVGPMIANTLVGSLIVEKIFRIPGLGGQFVSSISNRDYTVIMGTTIFFAALVVLMNLIVDIVYKIIDPRIELK